MAKFLTNEAVIWALSQLRDSCNGLFVDWLIVKRDGLRVLKPVTITTKSLVPSAERFMGIKTRSGASVDDERYFFNPFVWKWRHSGYPRSGTYTSLERSNTLRPIVNVNYDHDGMVVNLTEEYLTAIQSKLKRSKAKPLNLPILALSVWASRYSKLPDDISAKRLIEDFKAEYNIDASEVNAIFDTTDKPPFPLFSDKVLDNDDLISYLESIAPLEPKTDIGLEPESIAEDLPDNLIEYLRRDLLLPDALLRQLVTLLRTGKHIILTGPPGTGKSTLAGRLAEVSSRYAEEFSFPASKGHVFTTATADWTTFDTLGGYMPDPSGTGLKFQEGLFVQALREDQWLVVDELNRADVDKAFGQLFTVLSGHSAVMPYRDKGHNISLAFDRNSGPSHFSDETGRYTVGRDWRIIATMNTFDRNLLFQLSAAFVRRFAVVHVGIPSTEDLLAWIEGRGLDPTEMTYITNLAQILSEVRPLGPAIWADMVDYIGMRTKHSFGDSVTDSVEASFVDAVISYVLPQLDGLDHESLSVVEQRIVDKLESVIERGRLSATFKEVF